MEKKSLKFERKIKAAAILSRQILQLKSRENDYRRRRLDAK
jgi:hypothetical protein